MSGVVPRPAHAPPSFLCNRCDLLLFDGVHYQLCPRCNLRVDWVDLARPVWACPTCFRMLNSDVDAVPECPACHRALRRLRTAERPAKPTARRRNGTPPPEVVVGLGMALAAPLLSLSLHRDLSWFALAVAPALVLTPVALATLALRSLVDAWSELREVRSDRRIRALHGLEHATAHLLERQGQHLLGGRTHSRGFRLGAGADLSGAGGALAVVRAAAEEAIARLRAGEERLAFHPRCGSTWLVGVGLAAIGTLCFAAVGLAGALSLPAMVAVALAGIAVPTLLVRPLGLLLQRVATVEPRFAAATVTGVQRVALEGGFGYEVEVELAPLPSQPDAATSRGGP